MPNPRNQPRCGVCANKLGKSGKTTAGRTRRRCKHCGASVTQSRIDITRKAEFTDFLTWLTGTTRQGGTTESGRTFRHRVAWCWSVRPTITPTGEIHDQIMLDGTYFNGWCVLIAHSGGHVIDGQWSDQEKTASWTALIEGIPAPVAAIVDGNGPLTSTIKRLWLATGIQRCHFHIRQAAHKHLTRHPSLEANKELLGLYKTLSRVTTLEQAAAWRAEFATWEARWATFLKHRTRARSGPSRPAHVGASQPWWYTHIRTRIAHKLLANLICNDQLFTWLKLAEAGYTIAKTRNALEDGPNKAIKDLLRHHRCMSIDHARRGVDWLLYRRSQTPEDPWMLVIPAHWRTKATRTTIKPETGREGTNLLYGTAFSPEYGNGIQQGWGGRRR